MSVGECCGSSNNECEAGLIDGPYAAAGRGEVLRGFYCYYLAHELRRRYLEYPIKSARSPRFRPVRFVTLVVLVSQSDPLTVRGSKVS